MTPKRRVVLFSAALTAASLLAVTDATAARADEIAPELETLELRQKAQAEAKTLFARLAVGDQRRLAGFYVAFDSNASDPSAMAACDDDGDYVIVVTDAILRLIAIVARAQSYDEANGTRNVQDYASFIARSQLPGRRLLPPPPGFYATGSGGGGPMPDTRLREALSFVLARELTHLRAGDLACAHPTATHENGDDAWSSGEQRRAMDGASSLYPGRPLQRDAEATTLMLEASRTEHGALGFFRFLAQVETDHGLHGNHFLPTYLLQHPGATGRADTVRAAAEKRRSE